VTSLATVLDPEGTLRALPEERARAALETKLALIAASPQGSLLRSFFSPGDGVRDGATRLVLRIEERLPVPVKEAAFREARLDGIAYVPPGVGPRPDERFYVTGLSYLLTRTTRGVIASSWTTFLWSAAGILLMLTLAFRGPRLAGLAILPTLLSVALVLGLTGWSGVRLDLATALVASVALGLSVDDTFHCLLQFRRRRAHAPFRESLFASYHVTGAGVLLSSLAVSAGFFVLRFGEFVPFSNFGTMVAVATLGSSLGNLVLLPACLALGERLWGRSVGPSPEPVTPAAAAPAPPDPAP
jgi:hypothetical protein